VDVRWFEWASLFLAILALLFATFAIIRSFVQDRPKVTAKVRLHPVTDGNNNASTKWFDIEVNNKRRSDRIEQIGFMLSDKEALTFDPRAFSDLPRIFVAGEVYTFCVSKTVLDSMRKEKGFEKPIEFVWVLDATNRRFEERIPKHIQQEINT